MRFRSPDRDAFTVAGQFELDDDSDGIDLSTEEVEIELGTFSAILPPDSFVKRGNKYHLETPMQGIRDFKLDFEEMTFRVTARNIDLEGTPNAVKIMLRLGDDEGEGSIRMRGVLMYNDREDRRR